MPTWKVFMIQFLNIAGVGPIFGAIMGAQFGTAAYLWIVLGTIFAGATHDYLSAMMSLRQDGASLPELIGRYLGSTSRIAMSIFTGVLLILVGAVFTSSPASILGGMTRDFFSPEVNQYFWIILIFTYYIIATLCPVDKIIGKIYPFSLSALSSWRSELWDTSSLLSRKSRNGGMKVLSSIRHGWKKESLHMSFR